MLRTPLCMASHSSFECDLYLPLGEVLIFTIPIIEVVDNEWRLGPSL